MGEERPNARRSWWRRWLVEPVRAQLMTGATPEKLAWTIALGIVLGVFPIMGSTTLVCFAVGWGLKLNQPVLHVFKAVVYPLHLALILVFIHLGQRMFGVPPLSLSIPQLVERFQGDPAGFARDFGMAALHGVVAWSVFAPPAAWVLRTAALPVLRRVRRSLEITKEVMP